MCISKKTVDKNGKPVVKKDTWYIRLVDTLGFLQASFGNCVKSFPRDEFKMLKEEFGEKNFDVLVRKGVFPYEWFDTVQKLDDVMDLVAINYTGINYHGCGFVLFL